MAIWASWLMTLSHGGVSEPYRMFTSRAEFRIMLRADNAEERLTANGLKLGLVGQHRETAFNRRSAELAMARQLAHELVLTSSAAAKAGLQVNQDGQNRSAFQLMAMPNVGLDRLEAIWPQLKAIPAHAKIALEADALYAGYTDRQQREIAEARRENNLAIPHDLDYAAIPGLSMELRQKLTRVGPATLGHAMRIDGMTPAAIANLIGWIKRHSTSEAA